MWIREDTKLKKLFFIFTFLIVFMSADMAAHAAGNYLHTITLEKNDTAYNIILGTDRVAQVTKKSPSDNRLILELKAVSSDETVNAVYKGSNNIDGLVIENAGTNKLRIHITADNIKNSTIMIEPINGVTTIVGENLPIDKIIWVIFVMALFCVIFKFSKDIAEEDDKLHIKKDIKDREIEMYKKYRNEFNLSPEIIGKDVRMKKIMKKIDRKIDERLTSSIR